jgi:transposase
MACVRSGWTFTGGSAKWRSPRIVIRPARRIGTAPDELEAFAASLRPGDVITLEATGNAMAIARILEPLVRVVLANPKATKAATRLRAKTDPDRRPDPRPAPRLGLPARGLAARPHDSGPPPPGQPAGPPREAADQRQEPGPCRPRPDLVGRPPASAMFGRRGREWLAGVELPADERDGVEASLRAVAFLDAEVARLDAILGSAVLGSAEMRRLMTLPGVSGTTAATLVAVIGDVHRLRPAGWWRTSASIRGSSQSGEDAARHGRISKQGASVARQILVEAAWVATRTSGPLRAFAGRVAARRGWNVAMVAVARKLAVIAWHLLSRDEEYAYGRPSRLRLKLRTLELRTGSERARGRSIGLTSTEAERRLERERVEQAEAAYRRLVADRSTSGSGAGDATGAAHLTTLSVNQRGRDQPQTLHFGSAITRTMTMMLRPTGAWQGT